MIPENEMGVFYLFSRFHKELGFEKILSFQQFPDLIALKDGKKVNVELEYLASGVKHHYGYFQSTGYGDEWIKGKYSFEDDALDYVVCWKKDKELDIPVQVIELVAQLSDKVR